MVMKKTIPNAEDPGSGQDNTLPETSSDVDLLIVGQGLAGSAIAMRSLARGYSILVMDDPSQNRSSRVAAGLFNPITGPKMSKTWLADLIFPTLHDFYTQVEQITGSKFFFPLPIYRPFLSIQEQNEWMGKSTDVSFNQYINGISLKRRFEAKVNDLLGGLTLKQCGYLDTHSYLHSVRRYLEERNCFVEAVFRPGKLMVENDCARYETLKAKRVIFCQGVGNGSNPWFDFLPIKSLKGEVLTIQCAFEKDVILNRGVYMVPGTESQEWRVGATYNRNDDYTDITERARYELLEKLEALVRMPYSVTGQQWGLRPTTPDRKPILGCHPQYQSLIIFNGLGTKGVSLAPYFSEVLFRWMEGKGRINAEADLTRFY